jgi:two-component system phosphate regulon sensor histidine kinase PhoR
MKRYRMDLDLTAVTVLVAAGVLVPVMLSTAVGIVALVIARDAGGIVTGVLVICFAAAAAGSALITVLLTGRKARLARRQADFVAGVSHEFRTPLSAIRLYTQTLQSGRLAADPAATARCLSTILRETEWLDAMIDRVLTWRASSHDMLPMEMKAGTVAGAVEDAAARFRAMTEPDGMEFTSSVDTSLVVRHDAGAINAVVLNLLTNAYKYTGSAKRIGLSVRDEDGFAAIEVRDNGLGISPAEARRIFQPFYRARRQHTGGTGLGLSIAKHIVESHGGAITVNSEEGQGSTFTVRLPADAK